MPTSTSEASGRRDPQRRSDTLALLYQGVFVSIVRLQAGRQHLTDPATFRRRIKEALQDAHKGARSAGYNARDVRDAEAAVVAFLDEAVLSLQQPALGQWVKSPLSVELYGDANAGEVFFDRLDELRGKTDSAHVADVGEVYLLCLLLGFEGKYSGPAKSEGQLIAERLRGRIERIRGIDYRLSPPFQIAQAAAPVRQVSAAEVLRRWWPACTLPVVVLLFLVYYFNLQGLVDGFVASLPGVR